MKTAFLSAFILAALTATAAAESETSSALVAEGGSVSVGAEFGRLRNSRAGVAVDGSLRLSDTPLFLHARYAHGISDGRSGYDQVRVGLEARACESDRSFCGFVGLDAGYQADHVVNDDICFKTETGSGCEGAHMETFARDFLVVPRAGFEVGKHLRWRTSIELPVAMRLDTKQTVIGAAITTGVGYAF